MVPWWVVGTRLFTKCLAPTSQCFFTLFFFLKSFIIKAFCFVFVERDRDRDREETCKVSSTIERAADKHPGLPSWTENFRRFKCGASLGFSWKQRSRSGS
jgi:hypothetical protein